MENGKKVILFYAWGSNNAGDLALGLGAVDLLSEVLPAKNITVVSRHGEKTKAYKEAKNTFINMFPGINFIPSPFGFSRQSKIDKIMELVSSSLLVPICLLFPKMSLAIFKKNKALKAIGECDIAVCNGGNLFYWNKARKSIPRLIAFAFPLLLSKRLKKKYGFLPQTLGPFEGISKPFFRRFFETASFLTCRESKSIDNLRPILGDKANQIKVMLDLAFFIKAIDYKGAEDILKCNNLIGNEFLTCTLRFSKLGDTGDLDEGEKEIKTAQVREFIERILAEKNYKIAFICQTEIDRKVTLEFVESLNSKFGNRCLLIEEYRPEVLKGIYHYSKYLIAMRVHSLIFSLSVNTPVFGIYYQALGPKMPGIMQDFKLEQYCFDLGSFEKETIRNAWYDLDNRSDEIRKYITEKIDELRNNGKEIVVNDFKRLN
ncbi:MAG: polysaccharide pyruvyl transferase family protein [Clostridia bacterium]|nr:polysaccharide pyruvyl transferase family protein [Clostridia bacterium]